jgi:hypothetical protein
MSAKRTTRPFTWGVLLGLAAAGIGGLAWHWHLQRQEDRRFRPSNAISLAQCERIHQAVAAYTRSNGLRPDRLERLVEGKQLNASELFDPGRSAVPGVDVKTGRFAVSPDVVYVAALRPEDPSDLVLLYTPVAVQRGAKLAAVRNRGQADELTPHEMVTALRRTHDFIGKELGKPFKSGPAAPQTRP